ncbi:isochorismatase family protein [Georgenia sp. AZ-5]|uniref:isochorismatase family protein n=1 Tax=Georgenia sp. AZ-5 TaxID=3367526 RepID=UPI0037541918
MTTETTEKTRALILVDVQPTFCEGGALPSEGANAVSERVARYTAAHRGEYASVITTQDWHIDPGDHFSSAPDFVDTWPPHGVAGTAEAELHPALQGLEFDASVKKGMYAAAYSGFEGVDEEGRTLAQILRAAGVQAVDVVGLVESHCVKETALDARKLGLETRVFTDLTVPVSPELGARAREQMTAAGIELAESGQD